MDALPPEDTFANTIRGQGFPQPENPSDPGTHGEKADYEEHILEYERAVSAGFDHVPYRLNDESYDKGWQQGDKHGEKDLPPRLRFRSIAKRPDE